MRGEMILIGDELLSGKISDKNARYAASALWALDLGFAALQVVGDAPGDIAAAFHLARRADFVIVSGGLGTTDDDITNQCAAEFFQMELCEHPLMLENLIKLAQNRGRRFNDAHRRMTMMPEGVELLDGVTAGWSRIDNDNRLWFFLPGIPSEFKNIMDNKVLPTLKERFIRQRVGTRHISSFGITEAEVGRRLAGVTDNLPGVGLGFYPVFPEEKLIITARANTEEELKQKLDSLEEEICRRLDKYVVVRGPESLEEHVGKLLKGQGLKLALAESCTGGLIGHRITQVPGSSAYLMQGMVVYSNQSKIDLLGVSPEIIDSFGAVSEQCAAAMALNARRKAGVDIGLSITGIAGPDGGSEEKSVGTVYVGLASAQGVVVEKILQHGGRDWVKQMSAEYALNLLRRYLAGESLGWLTCYCAPEA